jgi:hypothetical protein
MRLGVLKMDFIILQFFGKPASAQLFGVLVIGGYPGVFEYNSTCQAKQDD